jgi:transcriptional regulator with XRE-family HTH domain
MNIRRLNHRLSEKNISKLELAQKTGLTAQAINAMMRRNDCRISDLLKISKVVGVNLKYWLDEDELGSEFEEVLEIRRLQRENELLQDQCKDKEKLINRLEIDVKEVEKVNAFLRTAITNKKARNNVKVSEKDILMFH